MNEKALLRALFGVVAAYLVAASAPSALLASADEPIQSGGLQEGYPASSWGLGVVVPEGAKTLGGGTLRWENAANVTALVTLPSIENPDLPVYAVLSLMTAGGAVLQVGAGILGNETWWSAYADFDTNVDSVPPTYQQILNSSQPYMPQNSSVTISIFRSLNDTWFLEVRDVKTGSSVVHPYPAGAGSSRLKAGDQEAFALESYSRNQTTFENMGNLTMEALLVDGRPVVGGFYSYGDWAPSRNPLFVVGSLGSSPPIFISLDFESGSAVWSYVTHWGGADTGNSQSVGTMVALTLVVGLLAVAASAVLLVEISRKIGEARKSRDAPVH